MKLIIALFLTSFLFISNSIFAQKDAEGDVNSTYDSLIFLYENVHTEPNYERAEVLIPLVSNSFDGQNSLDDRIAYLLEALDILKDSTKRLVRGYNSLGRLYWLNGEPEQSIESMYKMADLAKSIGDSKSEGYAYANLGESHKTQKNYQEALFFEHKAQELFYIQKDTFLLFTVHTDMAETYYDMGIIDSSKVHLKKAIKYFTKPDDYRFQYVLALFNAIQAKLLALTGEYDSAKFLMKTSEEVFGLYKSNDLDHQSALNNIELGKIFLEQMRLNDAISFAEKGFNIGVQHQLKEVIQDGAFVLAQTYELRNQNKKSKDYYKTYYAYRDSIVNVENVKQIESLRADFEINQKQNEVNELTRQKKNQQIILILAGVIIIAFIVLVGVVYAYNRSKTRINKLLKTQKTDLERLNETKDKFFSIISHDLRGPLNSLLGVSKLIRHFVKNDNKKQLLEIADDMETSVERLTDLLDNLLGWALQQQGHFPNVPEKVNLNEMVLEVTGMFSNMANSKKIQLESSLPDHIDLWVDRNTTHTILRNLVNNSIKFTPENGKIDVTAEMEKDLAVISISDTGVGMPKDKINKIFKLSTKTSTYGTTGEKGLGLGLQLVNEFIEMNNGSVKIESEVGYGTTFKILLPLFEPSEVMETII